ncbi:hydrolase [Paenibacillus marchantiophytorum]|uniref:Hydrolase n=1 Tax=Paenibacillus marchantiophytorum TaxID=1619310 RepID=A0ABQ1FFA5_9BACL|nr:MBL fold metallo-hydrolase [Paenibacillus marchantiophytorum]GGA07987.1 hydrolase [Paenibacillus marchantiophytorum]
MQIANGLFMLELSVPVMGGIDVIHPTLLFDENGAVLVDTGFPGVLPLIRQAMEQEGVSLQELHSIIITHQDIDHIGSLPTLLSESEQKLNILATEIEKPYIQGEKMLIKITPEAIDKAVAGLPANVSSEWRQAFRTTLENPPKGQVTGLLSSNQQLPYAGGLLVIDTPGHTPGHISLYHPASKTLIAADALVVHNGQLLGPVPDYCVDYALAMQSVKKLTALDIDQVICFHGGLYRDNVNSRIAELAAAASSN